LVTIYVKPDSVVTADEFGVVIVFLGVVVFLIIVVLVGVVIFLTVVFVRVVVFPAGAFPAPRPIPFLVWLNANPAQTLSIKTTAKIDFFIFFVDSDLISCKTKDVIVTLIAQKLK